MSPPPVCVCQCVVYRTGTAEKLIGSRFQEYIDKTKVNRQFYCFQKEFPH